MSGDLSSLFSHMLSSQNNQPQDYCHIYDNLTKRESVYTHKYVEDVAAKYNWDLVNDDIHQDFYGKLNKETNEYDVYYAEETTYYGKYVDKVTSDPNETISNVHERDYMFELISDIGENLSGADLINKLKSYLDRDEFKVVHDFEKTDSETEKEKKEDDDDDDDEEDEDEDEDEDEEEDEDKQ
jgi:hypothetical protein